MLCAHQHVSEGFIWISGFTLCFFFNWTNNLVFTHCSIKSFFNVISALHGILLACVRAIYHNDNMFWREIFCEVFVPLTARFLSCFWVSGGSFSLLLTRFIFPTNFPFSFAFKISWCSLTSSDNLVYVIALSGLNLSSCISFWENESRRIPTTILSCINSSVSEQNWQYSASS